MLLVPAAPEPAAPTAAPATSESAPVVATFGDPAAVPPLGADELVRDGVAAVILVQFAAPVVSISGPNATWRRIAAMDGRLARVCGQLRGRVPVSARCVRARVQAAELVAVLGTSVELLPSRVTTAVALTEVARSVARERDRRGAASARPRPERRAVVATPRAPSRDEGHGMSGGSAGGTSGSSTLRVFAIANGLSRLPIPRSLRVKTLPDRFTPGELGISLPERPG